ncbi:Protein kinase-like (PK-like) [Glarea lozoyensis ATCC 20868]|uniref:non-specific serine/threonine protein kinase n=1 Tax=Glarea lozoyensis (strain ATCC 20868 / MF5171) TaxID=1116229 RepID=S3DG23_GLAL2|nr:Protein kinase-like (PK-like) [Glarea lozoyensis ATCC 20868]EPE25583.1 Protein kinase-like (PK-like) [Glarea lozoyensis ATCC 20868]
MGNSSGKQVCFDDDVNLNHFRLLRVVGKGAFGKVRIVERKDTGLTFALKYIRKDEVVRSESVRNILRERRMLEHLSYQFICNLRYSFQDIEYMYLVVDLMNGGDLRFHISRKTFTEEANVASDYSPGRQLTSKSGTLAYLAPEVYTGTGYGPGADWWSLGVLFYECIYNKRPFDGSTHSSLAAQITKANPNFPITNPPVTMPCLHAISSALEEDPSKRMGSMSFESFSDNPFFRPIDFEALERKEVEPVFIPSGEKTNFDATYDLEELLLEEAPLEARARRQKPREQLREDATDKEIREDELYRLIENQFAAFDYTQAAFEKFAEGKDPTIGVATSESPIDSPQKSPRTRRRVASTQSSVHSSKGSASHSASTQPVSRLRNQNSKSGTPSPSGSPPMDPPPLPNGHSQSKPPTVRTVSTTSNPKPPISPYQPSYSRPTRPGGSRKESMGGGMQVVLGETGSWTELAKKDATLPVDAKLNDSDNRPNGMLGFLSRKRGRGHSPKPQERGILGKEGARVVISSGASTAK